MDFNSSNLAWNKSFSAPDISLNGPLFRRVVIEEQFFPHNQSFTRSTVAQSVLSPLSPFPHSSLLPPYTASIQTRHFSCDQLASQAVNETFSSTLRTHTSTPVGNDNKPLQIMQPDSPMDIDNLTADSPKSTLGKCKKPTILDFVDLTFEGTTPVLRKRLSGSKMPSKRCKFTPKVKPKPSTYFSKTNIALFFVAALCVPLYDKLNYIRDIELEDLSNELNKSIVGQVQAVNQLTEALKSFKNIPGKHLLSLIGTTGVGKTHSVNLIKHKFMPKQIVEIDIDTFDVNAYRDYLNLYKSVPYLVILDDLSYKHMPKVIEVLNLLPDNKWILVIVVFNIQETEDIKTYEINEKLFDQIPRDLFQLDFMLHDVKFESFQLDFLRHHVEEFTEVYFDIIKDIPNWKELLGEHDFKTFGFKGLFEKMNILSK